MVRPSSRSVRVARETNRLHWIDDNCQTTEWARHPQLPWPDHPCNPDFRTIRWPEDKRTPTTTNATAASPDVHNSDDEHDSALGQMRSQTSIHVTYRAKSRRAWRRHVSVPYRARSYLTLSPHPHHQQMIRRASQASRFESARSHRHFRYASVHCSPSAFRAPRRGVSI